MALVDSEAAFESHCRAIDSSGGLHAALRNGGLRTFSEVAFSIGTPQAPASEADFQIFAGTIFPAGPTLNEIARLRRVHFEASTLMIAHVKSHVNQESAGSEVIRKLPVAEKQQRLEDQQTRLGGVAIVGELEPSHALIDLVNSMLDNNAVLWVPPSKCTKRESEIQIGTKEKSQNLVLENNAIKLAAPVSIGHVDTGNEMSLQWALQRRGVAFDQCRIIEWSTHQLWVQQLLTTLSKDVADGFNKVRIEQVIRADKELFTILANEQRGNIRPTAGGVLPIDVAFNRLRTDPRVIMHILPTMKSKSSAVSDSQPAGDGGGGRPNKKAKAKKPPTKKATALCPAELKDFHQRDENDVNICWAFNMKNGCKEKAANHQCKKGVHKCANCLRTGHGLASCRSLQKKNA